MNKEILEIEKRVKQFRVSERVILDLIFENHLKSEDQMVKHMAEDLQQHHVDLKELIAISFDGNKKYDELLTQRLKDVQDIEKKYWNRNADELPYPVYNNYHIIREKLAKWKFNHFGSSNPNYWFIKCKSVSDIKDRILALIRQSDLIQEKELPTLANELVGRMGIVARDEGASTFDVYFEVYSYILESYTKKVNDISFLGESKILLRDKKLLEQLFVSLWDKKPLNNKRGLEVLEDGELKPKQIRSKGTNPEPSTPRAKEAFNNAIQEGFMEKTESGYRWLYDGGSNASLAFFLTNVYNPDGARRTPYRVLERLFGVKYLASASDQQSIAKKPQRWIEPLLALIKKLPEK